jgi:hypothetical protein
VTIGNEPIVVVAGPIVVVGNDIDGVVVVLRIEVEVEVVTFSVGNGFPIGNVDDWLIYV